jgi:hypothetical protein
MNVLLLKSAKLSALAVFFLASVFFSVFLSNKVVYAADVVSSPDQYDPGRLAPLQQISTCVEYDFTVGKQEFLEHTYTTWVAGYGFNEGYRLPGDYNAQIYSDAYSWPYLQTIIIRSDSSQDCKYFVNVNYGEWTTGAYIDYPGTTDTYIVNITTTITNATYIYVGLGWCPASHYITSLEVCYNPSPEGGASCTTVADPHFTGVITDAWILAGTAAISDSVLTLAPGDIAAQNITSLTSNTDYNAVISVTNATTASLNSVNLILGVETEAIAITGPGYYATTFTTPNLGGPLAYAIENTSVGSATIEIDYTCLFLIGEGEPECIAPLNGEFNGPDNWEWYRGATYQPLRQNAYLPYNEGGDSEKSLLRSSSTYTLPELASGEYLLLRFTAETMYDQAGVLGAQVASGITDTTYFFEIYPYEYEFEADLSNMAGLDEATVAFANSGEDPVTGFTAEDDIYLDDVCLYVSDESPGLPGPVNPNPVTPVASNWTCYSCSAIPGILYGYGIDVYYLQEIYDGGVPVWDPVGWVPWLAAALWVHAGQPLACFIFTLWCWLLGIIQYLLNEFLNWFFWVYRSGIAFAAWLPLFVTWLALNLVNLVGLAGDWLLWFAQVASDFGAFLPLLLAILSQWIFGGFIWLAGNIGGFDLLIQLWNLAAPLLQALWSYISSVGLLALIINFLISFISSGWSLFLILISWIWENIFQGVSFPLTFYNAFDAGVSSSSFDYLLSCDSQNFWCSLLAGFQIINQTASHSVMYPAVIVGIIITTIFVFWNDIRALFSINVK